MLCEHERELVPPLPPSFLPELGDKRIRFSTPPLFPATVVVVVEATGLENMGNSAGFFPRGEEREGGAKENANLGHKGKADKERLHSFLF